MSDELYNDINRVFNATKTEYEKISGRLWQHQAWDPILNVPNEGWI